MRLRVVAAALLAVAAIGFIYLRARVKQPPAPAQETAHSGPILIPGVQEPEEMRVEPMPISLRTSPERMLDDAMAHVDVKGYPGNLLPALDSILAKYPDYLDGYLRRLDVVCDGSDQAAILSNINNALKYVDRSQSGKGTLGSLLSMRAKVEHSGGDDSAAMEDLDKAIHANIANTNLFATSRASAPEKSSSVCRWAIPDMDALVQRFPNDYRSYLFRGLYYGSFVKWNKDSLKPAIDNLRKAGEMNSSSALAHFFQADISYSRDTYNLKPLGEQIQDLEHFVLDELTKALTLDPNLLPALSDRAQVYFQLKQFRRSVSDYNVILSLDPKDAGAYNARGEAEMRIDETSRAISDFSKAIENGERVPVDSVYYENRADAYMQTRQWDLAIQDLTTAISFWIGHQLLLMNVDQFRQLYPEYQAASNDAIAHKLHQTFHSLAQYADFADSFLHKRDQQFPSTLLGDLYLKRSDTFVKAGDWRSAAVDFRRAANGFQQDPDYEASIDRWRELGPERSGHTYIDIKSFDDARSDSVKLWIKQASSSDATGSYSLQQFEFNCGTRQIRSLSFSQYNAEGDPRFSRGQDSKWESIVPDTLGEQFADGACHTSAKK